MNQTHSARVLAVKAALALALLAAALVWTAIGAGALPSGQNGASDTGTSYTWIAFEPAGSSEPSSIEAGRYLLHLEQDGDAAIRADCNWTAAAYDSNRGLVVAPMLGTPSMCHGPSDGTVFFRALTQASSLQPNAEGLLMLSPQNGGTLTLREVHSAP